MQEIFNFFSHPIFVVIRGVTTLILIVGILYSAYLWARGILPVLYRLGTGLSKRRIAVFAEAEFESLKNMLIDSRIFKEENIVRIHKNDLKKAEAFTLLLVHYKPFADKMEEILRLKKDAHALIVYAPQSEGFIAKEIMEKINGERNSIVVNFRGRLMNDILGCMMTTSYEAK